MIDGVSYHASGCECWAFLTYMTGLVPLIVRCECWPCLSDMVVDVFLPWSDVSAGRAFLTGLDILSVEEDEYLYGG